MPAAAVHFVERHCALLKSDVTEWEIREVLARRQLAALVPARSRAWIEGLLGSAELVSIAETIRACRDPDDDKFLELAVNGAAEFIISGDADLLSLIAFRNIAIVTPALFLGRLKPRPRG